jgi:hypothetical protein
MTLDDGWVVAGENGKREKISRLLRRGGFTEISMDGSFVPVNQERCAREMPSATSAKDIAECTRGAQFLQLLRSIQNLVWRASED